MSIIVVAGGRATSDLAISAPSASLSTELISASLRLRLRQEAPPVSESCLTVLLAGERLLLLTDLAGELVFSLELLAYPKDGWCLHASGSRFAGRTAAVLFSSLDQISL